MIEALPGTKYENQAKANIARTLLSEIEKRLESKNSSDVGVGLGLIEELKRDFPKYKQTSKATQLLPRLEKQLAAIEDRERKQREDRRKQQLRANAELEILNWSWGRTGSGSYVEAKGLVKNLTNRPLRRVQAVAEWYDSKNNFITSGTALIEYNPILPNQESPFSLLENYNPAMQTARIRFKIFGGGSLNVYREKVTALANVDVSTQPNVFGSLLKNLVTTPTKPRPVERRLAKSVTNAIRRQVEANWLVPKSPRDVSKLQVEIRIVLRSDGTVLDAQIVDQGRMNRSGEEFFRTVAESARRAVWRASPLRGLPPHLYDQWREITFKFTPPA